MTDPQRDGSNKLPVTYFMTGINYIVDEKGKATSVVIDLKKHRDLWEDLYDALVAKERKDDPRDSLAQVRARLQKSGKLKPARALRAA
jgi:hypothetical protein